MKGDPDNTSSIYDKYRKGAEKETLSKKSYLDLDNMEHEDCVLDLYYENLICS